MKILLFAISLIAISAHAEFVHKEVRYEIDGTTFKGHLIYDAEAAEGGEKLPGIFMVPNWMGPDTAATLKKAKEIADDEFAIFIADMYGTDVRPTNAGEASAAATFVRSDRDLMRARAAKSLEIFHGLAKEHPLDAKKTLGIGFCFGGGALLEFARTGSDKLEGIVSFHGDYMSPTLEKDAAKIKIPLLVLHGADDPYVPQEHVQKFIAAMQAASVDDWQLVQFSSTVHSFTDPTAKSKGAHYNERSAVRAFEMMDDFAEEVLELDN